MAAWNHITEYKLLVLDNNTWNYIIPYKLLVLDKNAWNHIIFCLVWFGLVPFLNDISTFVGYLMPKPFS